MVELLEALSDLALAIIQRVTLSVRVSTVARVTAYDPATQRVSALPSVIQEDLVGGQRVQVPAAEVHRIPVIHHGGSLRGLTFGLEVNDPVVLLVRDRSHEEVDNGAPVPLAPKASRRAEVQDSVALPGYVRPADGQPSAHFRSDGQAVFYMPSGESYRFGSSTAAFDLARADLVDARLDAIELFLETHAHAGVTTGSGTSGPATGAPSGSSTATGRVKVDE